MIAGGAFLLLVLALTGFLLFRGMAELNRTQQELTAQRTELAGYYRKDPFPSPGNVTREAQNVELLNGWVQQLLETARKGQVESEERTPSSFVNLLGDRRNRLLAIADGTGMKLPSKDFAFGFERYFAAGSSLPAPEDVPRLTQQLRILDELCTVLFEEQVSELMAVEREEFESGPSAGAARRGAARLHAATPDSVAKAGVLGPDDLFAKLHFVLEFKAQEKALAAVLNRLAAHRLFVVVTALTIDKDMPDVRRARLPEGEEAAEVGERGSERPADEGGAADIAGSSTNVILPRSQRLISGLPVQAPMRVTMELDVYRFRKPESKP
jgi:hypothetical protein